MLFYKNEILKKNAQTKLLLVHFLLTFRENAVVKHSVNTGTHRNVGPYIVNQFLFLFVILDEEIFVIYQPI